MSQLIDNELGLRVKTVGYLYSDIIKNLGNIFYCGGDCAEDIQTHLKEHLKSIPNNHVSSADTILRGIKELATENTTYILSHYYLQNNWQKTQYYDFDYDNQIIATEKYDTKLTYKHIKGYCPGVATIGNKIVYIENSDGNANVKFEQASTLTRAYNLLNENAIKINRSRMDAGSYSKEIIKVVASNSKLFYIRANRSADLYKQITEISKWETVEINFIKIAK